MEHRWGRRLQVALPVRIHAASLIGKGLTVDFSVSGAFIATTLPNSMLTRVQISFRTPADGARAMQRDRRCVDRLRGRHWPSKQPTSSAAYGHLLETPPYLPRKEGERCRLDGLVVRRNAAGFAVEWLELGSKDLVRLMSDLMAAMERPADVTGHPAASSED